MEVYGLELAQHLKEIKNEEGVFPQVGGLVGLPSYSRTSRSHLSFFINQRWVHSPMLCRAVEDAYSGLLAEGKHPLAILNIVLPTQEVDVNVHPAKAEIRFRREYAIFNAVQRAVARAIGALPLPTRGVSLGEEELMTFPTSIPLLRVVGQISSSYIIAEGPDGLYLIDQHAAHERVLYEKLLSQPRGIEVQGLLEPLVIEVSAGEEEVIRAQGENLKSYGFSLEPFGHRAYILRAAPALLKGQDLIDAVREVLNASDTLVSWAERLATSVACHGAVKAGQVLSTEEMRELVRQLESAKSPGTCPHGRPTIIHLSASQLEKEFGRR